MYFLPVVFISFFLIKECQRKKNCIAISKSSSCPKSLIVMYPAIVSKLPYHRGTHLLHCFQSKKYSSASDSSLFLNVAWYGWSKRDWRSFRSRCIMADMSMIWSGSFASTQQSTVLLIVMNTCQGNSGLLKMLYAKNSAQARFWGFVQEPYF